MITEKQFEDFIKKLKEKEMIMQIPKGAIGGRGGEFIKIIEVKEIDNLTKEVYKK